MMDGKIHRGKAASFILPPSALYDFRRKARARKPAAFERWLSVSRARQRMAEMMFSAVKCR